MQDTDGEVGTSNEEVFTFQKAPALLKPHNQIV